MADGPDTAGLRAGASLDAGDIARLLLEIVVPKFSDGGAVFALEGAYGGQSGQVVTRRLANRFVDEHGHPAEAVLPVGEAFAFPAGSPHSEALSGAGPQVFGRPDNLTMQRIRPAGREILSRHASFLAVPVTADGAVTGLLVTSRGAARGPFSAAEVAVIADLASRAGAGIAHGAELARRGLAARCCGRDRPRCRRSPIWRRSPGVPRPRPARSSAGTGGTSSRCRGCGPGWWSGT